MKVDQALTFAQLVGYKADRSYVPDGEIHGTTVLALRYDHGVLTLADRRATMGNLVMYDQAEKIMSLDDSTVVAISGSFAKSLEVCRLLKHSFKYYARMHLNEMSFDGKLQEVSRALAGNMPMAMQGVSVFVPILSAYDKRADEFNIFFFDAAGARFQNASYACAGSGSERIRGVFEYLGRVKKPWTKRSLEEVLLEGLYMLDIAADLDSATGGFAKVLPMARVLERSGNWELDQALIDKAARQVLSR